MTYKDIDYIFPFFVFFYGLTMTVVLSTPPLLALAEKHRSHPAVARFLSHRVLGVACLIVGSLWSLQNLWFGA